MDTQNICDTLAMKHRRAISPPHLNQRFLRNKMYILDDTWLEALKFLTCPQWMHTRLLCRQSNGIVQRNILRLPKMVLDSAYMYHIYERHSKDMKEHLSKHTIVAFDTVMEEKESTQWFMDRGFTLAAPVDIPAENVLISARKGKGAYTNIINVCIYGSAQVKIPLSDEAKRFPWFYSLSLRKPVLYYAQFNPVSNQQSWAYLSHFLKLIYHPTSYVKEMKMLAVNQKFIDLQKCNIDTINNEPRYIICELLSLKDVWCGAEPAAVFLSDLLKWLVRNVRAETIRFPGIYFEADYILLANFLLEASEARESAYKKINVDVDDPVAFLTILIKKFHKMPLFESAVRVIKFLYFRHYGLPAHLGSNLIDKEVDSQGADELYMISNGQNQMRISFRRKNNRCNVNIYSI